MPPNPSNCYFPLYFLFSWIKCNPFFQVNLFSKSFQCVATDFSKSTLRVNRISLTLMTNPLFNFHMSELSSLLVGNHSFQFLFSNNIREMGRCSLVWFFIVLSAMAFGAGPVLGGSYEDCETKRCSDKGPNITYPFYRSGNNLCGYPGFEIECQTNGTTSFGGYVVQNISYGNSLLHVMNKDAIDRFCIGHEPKRASSIFGNVFLQRRTDDSLCFFYNCTNSSPDPPKSVKSCYSNSTFVALVQPNYTDATKTLQCKWFEVLPVDLREGDRNKRAEELDYRRLLEDGITLDWAKLLTASSCNGCQQSGGRCGRPVVGDFVCFCPDGTSHHDNCNHGKFDTTW